jgi:hypothetical protein
LFAGTAPGTTEDVVHPTAVVEGSPRRRADAGDGRGFLKEAHGLFAKQTLVLVILHPIGVIGVLVASAVHREKIEPADEYERKSGRSVPAAIKRAERLSPSL